MLSSLHRSAKSIDQDISLVARFSEGSFHKPTVKATKGGSVSIHEIEMPATVEIPLTAEPDENYQFVKWEAAYGRIQEIHSASTTFTMPARDVTVTAVFMSSDDNDRVPETGDGASLILWICCALVGMYILFAAVYTGKRKKNHKQ